MLYIKVRNFLTELTINLIEDKAISEAKKQCPYFYWSNKSRRDNMS